MSLNELAHSAMATDWVAGACITCLIYDHVLTLSQEISGIWWSRFSISKVLFFLNRYVVAAMIV
ncbi:hypothetical protein PLICRDRAFT_176400 [Plicaturopsis crispa FD-325 SS-3]|nr:hypothetical protein PLICRDRAFT_176400 [Plicaturopsis crispa FD-325 SS-3]